MARVWAGEDAPPPLRHMRAHAHTRAHTHAHAAAAAPAAPAPAAAATTAPADLIHSHPPPDPEAPEWRVSSTDDAVLRVCVYTRVCEAMAFLFSDANLRSDAFLRAHMAEDGSVSLAVFLGFHRIARITQNVAVLARALTHTHTHTPTHTPALVLTHGGTRVSRVPPYVPAPDADVDARIVYAERLPLHSHHESVRAHFERVGAVACVRMPRWRGGRAVRGGTDAGAAVHRRFKDFAFVEFTTVEAAERAVREADAHARDAAMDSSISSHTVEGAPAQRMRVMSKRAWLRMKQDARRAAVEARQRELQEQVDGVAALRAMENPADAGHAHASSTALQEHSIPAGHALPHAVSADAAPASAHHSAWQAPRTLVPGADLVPGTVVRVDGIPIAAPFHLLRALSRVGGRPRFLDCPAVFNNGVQDARSQATRAQSTLRASDERGITHALIRYYTPAEALASVAFINTGSATIPPGGALAPPLCGVAAPADAARCCVRLLERPLSARLLTAVEEAAYWRDVLAARTARVASERTEAPRVGAEAPRAGVKRTREERGQPEGVEAAARGAGNLHEALGARDVPDEEPHADAKLSPLVDVRATSFKRSRQLLLPESCAE